MKVVLGLWALVFERTAQSSGDVQIRIVLRHALLQNRER